MILVLTLPLSAGNTVCRHATNASAPAAAAQSEFDILRPLSVIRAKNGETVPLVSVFQVGQQYLALWVC